MKVLGTVKRFSVRNGYSFINRNASKEDVFVHQTSIKNNPRKYLRSVGDGETVEFELKEKRVRRQQMLQALVEFQFKAVNTQTVTIIDAIHLVGVLQAITSKIIRIVRVGKRTRDGEALLKVRTSNGGPIAGEGSHLTTCGDPMCVDHSIPTRPVQEVRAGADNQGAGEQGRQVRQNMYPGYRPRFRRGLLAKDSLKRMAMKRTKKIKEMRPKVSSHLNLGIAATSITDAEVQRTRNHRRQRDKQPIHQLPRLSRARLSKCRLTISTIIRFGRPTRNEYEIPAIRIDPRLELLFA